MKIAFASGKGGTGKTTVAVNFACHLAASGQEVQYLDCDVEEPNGYIFLKPVNGQKNPVKVMVPIVDNDKCTHCGKCAAECRFNAIIDLKDQVMIFPELCHGCALCSMICPADAIREGERDIGYIEEGEAQGGISFVQGVLNVGEPMAGPVITAVKKYYKDVPIKIIDSPPGTSCPVVKTIADTDFVVFVTEPAPFGLHDLKIAVSVAVNMQKPFGVVINRDREEQYMPLMEYLDQNKIPVIMRLPEDMEIARSYSRGEIILNSLPQYTKNFNELEVNILELSKHEQQRNKKRL